MTAEKHNRKCGVSFFVLCYTIFGIRNYSLWVVGREWSLPNRDTAKVSCQCGYNLSYKSIDFHDILNQPNSDFYLIFFGKSRIITIGSLEAGAKVVLTTFRLPQLALGITTEYVWVVSIHG